MIRRILKITLRVALALFAVVFIYLSVIFVQVWMAARRDDARTADAIVVMGAAQFDGRPSKILQARLDHALDLYNRGIAKTVVVTGGKLPADRFTEAESGAAYLAQKGVPESAILRENEGRTSWQSLSAVANSLKAREQGDVVLVTDPYHSARVEDIAHELDLRAATSPTKTSPIKGAGEWRRFFTETVRIAAGKIFGYGRLDRHRQVENLVPGLATLWPPLRRPRRRDGPFWGTTHSGVV